VDDPKVRRPDTTRAEQLLGWRPTVPSEEGLRRTVAWFAEQRQEAALRAG
jgi:dTDP-glucose 4,6-dehydratase